MSQLSGVRGSGVFLLVSTGHHIFLRQDPAAGARDSEASLSPLKAHRAVGVSKSHVFTVLLHPLSPLSPEITNVHPQATILSCDSQRRRVRVNAVYHLFKSSRSCCPTGGPRQVLAGSAQRGLGLEFHGLLLSLL